MNYKHIYHAGNFTEVVKHSVLTLIIDYLRKKEAAFCFIDTHAGEGIYDLSSEEAEKTGEAAAGAQRIIVEGVRHPECMQTYLRILKSFQTGDKLSHYPGSPFIAYQMLRAQDGMILNEYHPQVYQQLKQNFSDCAQVAIHKRDAYEFLPAILPPRIPRGLVLIDPPFESRDENANIQAMLMKSLKRWPQGIYLLWYPVTTARSWNVSQIALQSGIERYLTAKFTIAEQHPESKGLLGCELLIINPPWQLAETLTELLKHLWEIFNMQGHGKYLVKNVG